MRFKYASLFFVAFCIFALLATGCSRFHSEHDEKVYVSAHRTFLRDRVAPVSTRTAEVTNGQELEVIGHGRHFLKVKTQKNQIGWIVDSYVIDSATHAAFLKLAEKSRQDPVVATATLHDELYMHVRPGRGAPHFYLLPANTRVQLLARASVPRTTAQGASIPLKRAPRSSTRGRDSASRASGARRDRPSRIDSPARPVVMEDWWLARDKQGQTGWMLGSRLDVDVPYSIAVYTEEERIVGAYVLARVVDPKAKTPNHQVPEYVTALSPRESGLPYDFDQVRVFTWSLKHHRYETAFRLRGIQGFLPLTLGSRRTANGSAPTFSFQIANGGKIITDPETGISRPASPRTLSYVMLDTIVRRIRSNKGSIPAPVSRKR